MVTLYIYDIIAGKEYNKIKRRFYYHLLKIKKITFISKSCMLIDENSESKLENLFKSFKKYIVVFKIQNAKPIKL